MIRSLATAEHRAQHTAQPGGHNGIGDDPQLCGAFRCIPAKYKMTQHLHSLYAATRPYTDYMTV